MIHCMLEYENIFSCDVCNWYDAWIFHTFAYFTEDEPPKTMMATEGGDDNLPPQVSAS